MEVQLSPAQEAQLDKLATATGRRTDELVLEAIDRLLAYNEWFKEQVKVGLNQIERGEIIEEEEMDARIERMFRS